MTRASDHKKVLQVRRRAGKQADRHAGRPESMTRKAWKAITVVGPGQVWRNTGPQCVSCKNSTRYLVDFEKKEYSCRGCLSTYAVQTGEMKLLRKGAAV